MAALQARQSSNGESAWQSATAPHVVSIKPANLCDFAKLTSLRLPIFSLYLRHESRANAGRVAAHMLHRIMRHRGMHANCWRIPGKSPRSATFLSAKRVPHPLPCPQPAPRSKSRPSPIFLAAATQKAKQAPCIWASLPCLAPLFAPKRRLLRSRETQSKRVLMKFTSIYSEPPAIQNPPQNRTGNEALNPVMIVTFTGNAV